MSDQDRADGRTLWAAMMDAWRRCREQDAWLYAHQADPRFDVRSPVAQRTAEQFGQAREAVIVWSAADPGVVIDLIVAVSESPEYLPDGR